MKALLLVLTLFSCVPAFAATECSKQLESMPILSGGRLKPLAVHAKEHMRFISGKSKWQGQAPTVTYCQLSLSSIQKSPKTIPAVPIRVDHIETQRLLGIPGNEISYQQAVLKLADMERQEAINKTDKNKSAAAKDLSAVIQKTRLYYTIRDGSNWRVPFVHAKPQDETGRVLWVPLRELVGVANQQSGSSIDILQLVQTMGSDFTKQIGDGFLIELTFEKLHLFHWAILAVLLTLIIAAACRSIFHPAVMASLAICYIMEIAAVVFRVIISQRGPVTNMYETVMWVGIGGLLIATILAYWRREKPFLLVGLGLNLSCLFMMTFAHGMLSPAIKPLVPVLRDNFWLSTHVTVITISYAVFALSWILANSYMVRASAGPVPQVFTRRISSLCYDCLKVGVILLAAGIILGGVWADYSWGRFWGWDPKETWALIALLIYIAILHGRFAGWIPFRRFIPLVALSFLGIIMTWFGVNYILAAGLHSYGFSEGGALFIVSITATQLLILTVYLVRQRILVA